MRGALHLFYLVTIFAICNIVGDHREEIELLKQKITVLEENK